jgi:hypothetical protein
MVDLDFAHSVQPPAASFGWGALMAHLDLGAIEVAQRRPPLEIEVRAHLQHVQQMLVAATIASSAIVTVAAVMMLRLF